MNAPSPIPDPRAQSLEVIRQAIAEADELAAKVSRIRATVFSETYSWVTATVAGQHAKSAREAIAQLASLVGKSSKAVESWCYCGKLMADRNLPPEKVDPDSVRAVYTSKRKLQKSALTRAVAMVREGRPTKEIRKHISRHTELCPEDAKRAASRASNAGDLTPKTVQGRALILAALAREAYRSDDVVVSVLVDGEQVAVAR